MSFVDSKRLKSCVETCGTFSSYHVLYSNIKSLPVSASTAEARGGANYCDHRVTSVYMTARISQNHMFKLSNIVCGRAGFFCDDNEICYVLFFRFCG